MSPAVRTSRKPGRPRILGVDDGPFGRRAGSSVLVVGAVCRAGGLEGVLSTRVRRDGWNATDRITRMIVNSKFHPQLHAVMLDGVAVGGFNVIDIAALNESTGLPVITVMRKKPDLKAIEAACGRLPNPRRRMAMIRRAGTVHRAGPVCFQAVGMDPSAARSLLMAEALNGHIPEPVRLAHLIAGGVVTGQSGKRA